jgi:hypothetical protein
LKKLFKSQDYVMTYFHPRDFDAGQPLIPGIKGLRRFKSYIGISYCKQKLSNIIDQNYMGNVCSIPINTTIKL